MHLRRKEEEVEPIYGVGQAKAHYKKKKEKGISSKACPPFFNKSIARCSSVQRTGTEIVCHRVERVTHGQRGNKRRGPGRRREKGQKGSLAEGGNLKWRIGQDFWFVCRRTGGKGAGGRV